MLAVVLAGVGLYGVTPTLRTDRRGNRHRPDAWTAPVVATLVYGLTPRDGATIAMATLLLAAVAAVAGWIPARRVARIDPARVLRDG